MTGKQDGIYSKVLLRLMSLVKDHFFWGCSSSWDVRALTTLSIPLIKCLAILYHWVRQPFIIFRAKTKPSDWKLMTTTPSPRINDGFDLVFFQAIRSEDRPWPWAVTIRKQWGIIGYVLFQLWCMICWINCVVIVHIKHVVWGFGVHLSNSVWSIPLGEKLGGSLVTFSPVFLLPMGSGEHDVISYIVDNLGTMVSICIVSLKNFSSDKVVPHFVYI